MSYPNIVKGIIEGKGPIPTRRVPPIRCGSNLFDKKMPIVASSQNNADPSVFDPVGRAWYVGLKLSY